MNKKIISLLSLSSIILFTSCSFVDVNNIAKVDSVKTVDNNRHLVDWDNKFNDSYNKFASKASILGIDSNENTCISPISIYSALSMLTFSTIGNTQAEILKYMNTTEEDLKNNYKKLYEASNYYDSSIDDYRETLFNSIWLHKDFEYNEDGIKNVSNNACANIYTIDFTNKYANEYIRDYIKDNTHDLIDQNFNLDSDTKLALINTLYLNDPWFQFGDDLGITNDKLTFTNSDNSKVEDYFMVKSRNGKAFSNEEIRSMSVSTYNGYKITFIVPNDNYKISDVFNEENIYEAINTKYDDYDKEKYSYKTINKFPKFSAESNFDIIDGLIKGGINDVFNPDIADFSPISKTPLYCDKIIHSTKLGVDRKGIIGAATTVVELMDGTAAPDRKIEIVEEFVVDRAFGYLVSDYKNRVIFSGIINKI